MKLDIIGKTIGEAASVMDAAGMSFRVVSRDGVPYLGIANHDVNRVNLVIVDKKITSFHFG